MKHPCKECISYAICISEDVIRCKTLYGYLEWYKNVSNPRNRFRYRRFRSLYTSLLYKSYSHVLYSSPYIPVPSNNPIQYEYKVRFIKNRVKAWKEIRIRFEYPYQYEEEIPILDRAKVYTEFVISSFIITAYRALFRRVFK